MVFWKKNSRISRTVSKDSFSARPLLLACTTQVFEEVGVGEEQSGLCLGPLGSTRVRAIRADTAWQEAIRQKCSSCREDEGTRPPPLASGNGSSEPNDPILKMLNVGTFDIVSKTSNIFVILSVPHLGRQQYSCPSISFRSIRSSFDCHFCVSLARAARVCRTSTVSKLQ